MITFFLIFILVSIWTFNSYIKKVISEKIPADQIVLIVSFFAFSLIIVYALIKQLIFKKTDIYINFFNNKNVTKEILFKLLFMSILGFIASIIFIYLLNKNNFSIISPLIHSSEIVFSMVVGYLFLNEVIGFTNIIGAILIICGIIVIES